MNWLIIKILLLFIAAYSGYRTGYRRGFLEGKRLHRRDYGEHY